MAARPLDDTIAELAGAGRTDRQIGTTLGLHEDAVRRARRRLGLQPGSSVPRRADGAPASSVSDRPLVSPLAAQPITLEELLATFGLDPAEWEAVECTPNVWHVGSAHPETGEIIAAPLYQLKARVKRRQGADLVALRDGILADVRAATAARARVSFKPITGEPDTLHALLLDIFDLHLGKLGWAEEVGENYDAKIAATCAREAVREFLWQARPYRLEQIVLPIGNDFFNADNLVGTTTGGTRQDVDTRFHLMFRRGWHLASWMIAECAQVAPVVVPVVPGNHDRQTAFLLGCVLEAEYASDPRVTIDNSARVRKYHAYGENLFGFTHGDEEKPADLPQLMATEQPTLWAGSSYREFHIGHFHHAKEKAPLVVDDKTGVTVRWIRSLSGSDRWHSGKGYVGRRGAEAFVYRKSGGLRAHLFTSPQQQDAA
jgi:hypothetical protein